MEINEYFWYFVKKQMEKGVENSSKIVELSLQ